MEHSSQNNTPAAQLSVRPPHYAPDRHEVVNLVADTIAEELAPGVVFRPLVGEHNGSRGLTTGLLTAAPGAVLPYHSHPFTESVTVLSGFAVIEVEGYRYKLGPLDNITIPAGTAHTLVNVSSEDALIHTAMPISAPSHTVVHETFERQETSADSLGREGAESLIRHVTAPRYEANPGASFINFFNRGLGCEEMSGGYGIFAPGSRLPCHLHDFDESITIVQGEALCVVEGKCYSLSNNSTALVPRGRCHYFINASDAPMAMVWVYAGPLPERIKLEDGLCNVSWSKA